MPARVRCKDYHRTLCGSLTLEVRYLREVGMSRSTIRMVAAVSVAAAVVGVVSCGGGDGTATDSSSSGGSSSGGAGGTLAVGGSSSGGTSATTCQTPADDTGCVGAEFEGKATPLDIYVMFDLSCSMSCPVGETGCCLDDPDPPAADSRLDDRR